MTHELILGRDLLMHLSPARRAARHCENTGDLPTERPAEFELKRIQVGNYVVLINSSDCRRMVVVGDLRSALVSVARTRS